MKIPFFSLRNEAELEAYIYFDKQIRELPKNIEGHPDIYSGKLWNNDVDAFRHAYVSGVFTQEYGKKIAEILGAMTEFLETGNPKEEENMDLWNNKVGRKYGKQVRSRLELADMLHQSLRKGELIISPDDPRKYNGARRFVIDPQKPVVVCEENKTGRNELFLDLQKYEVMKREEFSTKIVSGIYPGYLIANIDSLSTPFSMPDDSIENNLG